MDFMRFGGFFTSAGQETKGVGGEGVRGYEQRMEDSNQTATDLKI
jgi:hypothetical protein